MKDKELPARESASDLGLHAIGPAPGLAQSAVWHHGTHLRQDVTVDLHDHSIVDSWHAHGYFDASRREAAWDLREIIEIALAGQMDMGRFHEQPVGPHPKWSYPLEFAALDFARVVGWLTLNHGLLDVFVHPNTGDELGDHRDCARWLGNPHVLNLAALGG